jgi:hypothetical protein
MSGYTVPQEQVDELWKKKEGIEDGIESAALGDFYTQDIRYQLQQIETDLFDV